MIIRIIPAFLSTSSQTQSLPSLYVALAGLQVIVGVVPPDALNTVKLSVLDAVTANVSERPVAPSATTSDVPVGVPDVPVSTTCVAGDAN